MTFNMIVGIIMVVVIVVLLLKEITNAGIAFGVVSIVGAVAMGFTMKEIGKFLTAGFGTIGPITFLMVFAILYFNILHEQNVFKVLVRFIVKKVGRSPVAVTLVTNFLAMGTQLDGSGATTCLCTMPPMRPIYERMGMRRTTLMIVYTFGGGAMVFLPWAPGINELMAYVGSDSLTAFNMLLPIMVFCIVLSVIAAIIFGLIEKRRVGTISDEEFEAMKAQIDIDTQYDASRKGIMIFDTVFTLVLVVLLLAGFVSAQVAFAVGLFILLVVNYGTGKEQREYLKRQAGTVIGIVVTMFGLAMYLGIANGTGVFNDLAKFLAGGLPDTALIHLPFITCMLVVPLQIFLGNAAPAIIVTAIASLTAPLGVDPVAFMATYFAAHTVATTCCLFSGSAWLGIELCGLTAKDMIKSVMGPCIIYSWFITFACVAIGLIPL